MSTRDLLAAAANTVAGITATPYVSNKTKAGTVFVRLDHIDYPNKFGGVAHWNVVLILPQEQDKAEKYLEAKLPQLKAAIDGVMPVTSVRPQRVDLPGAGIQLCAFLNGRRTAD